MRWVRGCIDAHAALAEARQTAHALAGAASHEFATLYATVPDSPERRFIEGLPAWVLARA